MVAASPQYGFANCKRTGNVSVDLLVASAQGVSVCICQLQAPTARDVNVELIVHKPTEATQSNTIVLVTIATHQHIHPLYLLLFILEVNKTNM